MATWTDLAKENFQDAKSLRNLWQETASVMHTS
jgi:hypothetical protein